MKPIYFKNSDSESKASHVTQETHASLPADSPIDILIHELKQPLWCILVLGERIQKMIQEIPEDAYKKHATLKQSITSLLVSVEQMKEIMHARSAIAHLEDIQEGWGEKISQYCTLLQTSAAERGVSLIIENSLQTETKGPDTKALNQILSNLIHNAIEALDTEHDKQVILEIYKDEQTHGMVIKVHDSGPGIPQTLQNKIFERGFTTKQEKGGSGYGLWVCRKLTEALSGTLSVKNSPRLKGALFEIYIPISSSTTLDQVA